LQDLFGFLLDHLGVVVDVVLDDGTLFGVVFESEELTYDGFLEVLDRLEGKSDLFKPAIIHLLYPSYYYYSM
jgi:hypothetical protein